MSSYDEIYREGYQAFINGCNRFDNPYSIHSNLFTAWESGFEKAEDEHS